MPERCARSEPRVSREQMSQKLPFHPSSQPWADLSGDVPVPQATDELEEAQAQLASTQAAMNDLLRGGLLGDGKSAHGSSLAAGPAPASTTDRSDINDAANGFAASIRMRNAELQKDRDDWRRSAERASADLAALREHVTAVCAEGRHAEAGLLNAQQVTPADLLPGCTTALGACDACPPADVAHMQWRLSCVHVLTRVRARAGQPTQCAASL